MLGSLYFTGSEHLAPFNFPWSTALKHLTSYTQSTCNLPEVQYRPRALQHLHVRKSRAIWRISTKNPRKKPACKFLRKLLHADFLHANLSVLLRWLILLIKVQTSCVYFFTTENVADVKLEMDIVEKRHFTLKEKTTYYTLSVTTIMLQSRTSCFVVKDFLGCWLKHNFTCKIGCMLLATTVVLK